MNPNGQLSILVFFNFFNRRKKKKRSRAPQTPKMSGEGIRGIKLVVVGDGAGACFFIVRLF